MDRSWPLLTLGHDHAVRVIRVGKPLSFLDLEVMVREVHVGVPVVGGDVVLARADAIADGALDQLRASTHAASCSGPRPSLPASRDAPTRGSRSDSARLVY